MDREKWFVPSYYPDFRCKADRCRSTCCSNWQIPVSHKEYNQLVTMERTEDLDRRIQSAFVVPKNASEERYRLISFNWLGFCPIQEKGLCRLHMEKGEDYLPKICRFYPRSLKKISGHKVASCSSSCERILEMLYEGYELHFIQTDLEEMPQIEYSISEEDIRQIALFQEIVKDRNSTLAESIAQICKIVDPVGFEKDSAEDLEPLKEVIEILEKLDYENRILKKVYEYANERYETDRTFYDKDKDAFEKKFPDWMVFFERVINNSMVYECFPFFDPKANRTDSYKGLCVCYGLLRFVCICYCAVNSEKEDLIDIVAALFRLIDHTSFYYNASLIVKNAAVFLKL